MSTNCSQSDYGYITNLPRLDHFRNTATDFHSTKMSSFGSQQTNLGNEISEEDAIKHIKRKIAVNQNIRALAESELQRQKSLVKV